jgi:restriction system protein
MIGQKRYVRVMLGKGSMFADLCYKQSFIGADFDIHQDLKNDLPDDWRDFNKKFVPIFLKNRPDKSKVAAGLACGALWTICKGLSTGDIVLCPRGDGNYLVGEVNGPYSYRPGTELPHTRGVRWYSETIPRASLSQEFRNSSGSIGTTCDVTKYAQEIEAIIAGKGPAIIVSSDPTIEDPSVFGMEKHLEEFLVHNWSNTELGKKYNIFVEDGEIIGQQYQTDTGPIDILAVSKDNKELLVVELKKGRASDFVVGQIQRYMGYVKEELAEDDQIVKGVIIALEDDLRIKRALSVANNIEFYRYKVSFSLVKG